MRFIYLGNTDQGCGVKLHALIHIQCADIKADLKRISQQLYDYMLAEELIGLEHHVCVFHVLKSPERVAVVQVGHRSLEEYALPIGLVLQLFRGTLEAPRHQNATIMMLIATGDKGFVRHESSAVVETDYTLKMLTAFPMKPTDFKIFYCYK